MSNKKKAHRFRRFVSWGLCSTSEVVFVGWKFVFSKLRPWSVTYGHSSGLGWWAQSISNRYIDIYSLLYPQSTAKGHIRAKQNALFPATTSKNSDLLLNTYPIAEDWRSLGEKEVEWAGIDWYLMFYITTSQTRRFIHIRSKYNALRPQVKFWFILYKYIPLLWIG